MYLNNNRQYILTHKETKQKKTSTYSGELTDQLIYHRDAKSWTYWGEGLIHGTRPHKDNQSWSLKHTRIL